MSREARRYRGADLKLAALATLLVVLTALPVAAQSEPGAENRVVLRVNDRIVTLYEYQRAVAVQIRDIRNAPGLTDQRRQELLAEVGQIIMKALFEEQLILSRADQLAVTVNESDVEEQIRGMWERAGIETEEQFRDALAQQGMREQDFREQMRKQLRSNIVRGREVAPRVDLADERPAQVLPRQPGALRDPRAGPVRGGGDPRGRRSGGPDGAAGVAGADPAGVR